MNTDSVIPLLLIVGLVGVAAWLLMRNNSGSPAVQPCGVPVSYGGAGTVVPCDAIKSIAALPKTIASAINRTPGGIVSYGAANGPSVQGNHAGVANAPAGVGGNLAFIADAMCNCYGGGSSTYNGKSSCEFVHAVAPEIDTCVKGDCDCHPTFKGPDGTFPNPTPRSTQICYKTSKHGPMCVTIAAAMTGIKL